MGRVELLVSLSNCTDAHHTLQLWGVHAYVTYTGIECGYYVHNEWYLNDLLLLSA